MNLQHGERPHAGFEWEDRIAKRLINRGHKVQIMPRNNSGYDLLIDGHLRVDVKATVHTSYAGSDGHHIRGWVFSNLHNPPTCDLYVLVCLTRERKTVEKYYIIPSNIVMQRTVTITERDKYVAYKNAWSWFEKMKKTAALFSSPQDHVYRRNDPYTLDPEARRGPSAEEKRSFGEIFFPTLGAAVGITVGLGISAMKNKLEPGHIYLETPFTDQDLLAMGIGGGIGAALGRTYERRSRRAKTGQP